MFYSTGLQMDPRMEVLVLLLLGVGCILGDFEEPHQSNMELRSMADAQTRFPCLYRTEEGEKVVQVTWYKELPDGTKEQIITAHFQDGHTEFGRYSGRVKFESSTPTENSALLIPSTEVSDEGRFTCHISTFPNGNFERHFTLTVWILPISTLEPVILVEGQPFGVVASCRAVGRPVPELSWDTDLPGQFQTRIGEGGTVTSQYSLHPLRSMTGKSLDCLVSHPGLKEPRRITNQLVVQYPPDATISASPGHLYVGLEEAELVCGVVGFPKPQNITWTWRGGPLPDGVSVVREKLAFGRALRLNDSGVYECSARNGMGVGKAEYTLNIAEKSERKSDSPADNMLLIITGASAAAAVLVLVIVVLLVNRHHRRRNKKLELELSEKKEEINNLSRQPSFRRMNSVSTDPRVQPEDYIQFIGDDRIKNSQMSLGLSQGKGSQSTLGGKWGTAGGVELDELGRPVIWVDEEESLRGAEIDGGKEERNRRMKANLKGSNMSLDSGLPSSLVPLKAQQDDCNGPRELNRGHLREEDSPSEEDWAPAPSHEGHEDEESNSSYQISEALTNHFYYSNGVLRPKPHSNAILLHSKAQII